MRTGPSLREDPGEASLPITREALQLLSNLVYQMHTIMLRVPVSQALMQGTGG